MTTTIELPEPFYQSACKLAKLENRPLSEWMELLLVSALETLSKERQTEDFTGWREELLK